MGNQIWKQSVKLGILVTIKQQLIVFVAQTNNSAVKICNLEYVKSCLNEMRSKDIINES